MTIDLKIIFPSNFENMKIMNAVKKVMGSFTN